MKAERLREYGELMFGPRWQSPLAEALSVARRKPLQQAQINKWLKAGVTPRWAEMWIHISAVERRARLDQRVIKLGVLIAEDFTRLRESCSFCGEASGQDAFREPEEPVQESGPQPGPDPTPRKVRN